ncbi:MAG: M23 family metallopeptidase [Candidatus Moraniibacteriota bacterium]
MKKYFIIPFLATLIIGLVFWRVKNSVAPVDMNDQAQLLPIQNNALVSEPTDTTPVQKNSAWLDSLDRAKERVAKKPFGIYIDPKNSPVQPERFSGYHTGTDFEIFPEEVDAQIAVRAICDGKLILKKTASGYGGVAVELCTLDNQPVTIVYGHLKLSSITKAIGEDLKAGDTIGQLGTAYSPETDGERKHLHLSIHEGSTINLLGYVQEKNELKNWINPCFYVCK